MNAGRLWSVRDRYGNNIYLTEERWEHIIDPENHPEMEVCEDKLKETIRSGRRTQDSLNPQKYRYSKAFDDLAEGNTHIVAIVLCRWGASQFLFCAQQIKDTMSLRGTKQSQSVRLLRRSSSQ